MKKLIGKTLVISAILILTLGVIKISAQEPQKGDFVQVQIPEYTVMVNQKRMDSEHSLYPVLWYRGYTYLPLTWENMRYMGLKIRTFEGGVSICSAPIENNSLGEYHMPDIDNTTELYARIPEGDYYFNLKKSDSGLLFFRDIYYISTDNYDVINAFGWDKIFNGSMNGLSITTTNAVRPQNIDDSCINCNISRHGCKKYYFWQDGYVEYPAARQDDESFGEFVWKLRGEEEKRCDFTKELSNVKYLDTVHSYNGNGMIPAPIMPGVHNNVFVIFGAVYSPPQPKIGYTSNVIIGIDLKGSKVLMCGEYEKRQQ